jgi:hypothetical protein
MASQRKIEDYDRVLVVEGYSDLLFYAEVLEELGAHEKVFIQALGGKSGKKAKLETLVSPGLLDSKSAIAFVFDADTEPETTRNSLQKLLSEITRKPVVDGQWSGGKPNIGLFIVPGDGQPGEIETLVWNSWSGNAANAAEKQCVEGYIACMQTANATAHSPAKGLVGALLAVKNDEDPRLGPGVRGKVFNLERPELQKLRVFLSGFN